MIGQGSGQLFDRLNWRASDSGKLPNPPITSTAVAVTGGATLTGTGSLTAAATVIVSGSATLTGTGSLTASGTGSASGDATLTGTGSLTAAATVIVFGSATLTGTGSLTVDTGAAPVSITGGAPVRIGTGKPRRQVIRARSIFVYELSITGRAAQTVQTTIDLAATRDGAHATCTRHVQTSQVQRATRAHCHRMTAARPYAQRMSIRSAIHHSAASTAWRRADDAMVVALLSRIRQ